MSWKDDAEGKGADAMPYGFHLVTVVKCLRHRKNGDEFKSEKGPFLMVVYENSDEQECTVNYFLTPKARWKLARDLSRLGVSMDELDERGIEIEAFSDADFARNEMEGRTSWAQVSPGRSKYPDMELVTPDKVPAELRDAEGDTEQEQPEPQPEEEDQGDNDERLPF